MKSAGWKKILKIILPAIIMTGCSGQIVCEWQTENEQFEELIEKVIKELENATP